MPTRGVAKVLGVLPQAPVAPEASGTPVAAGETVAAGEPVARPGWGALVLDNARDAEQDLWAHLTAVRRQQRRIRARGDLVAEEHALVVRCHPFGDMRHR